MIKQCFQKPELENSDGCLYRSMLFSRALPEGRCFEELSCICEGSPEYFALPLNCVASSGGEERRLSSSRKRLITRFMNCVPGIVIVLTHPSIYQILPFFITVSFSKCSFSSLFVRIQAFSGIFKGNSTF